MNKLRDWWMRTTEEGRRDARENPNRGGTLTVKQSIIGVVLALAALLIVTWLT